MDYLIFFSYYILQTILTSFVCFLIIKFFLYGRISKYLCFALYTTLIICNILLVHHDLLLLILVIILGLIALAIAAYNFKIIPKINNRLRKFRKKQKSEIYLVSRKKLYRFISIIVFVLIFISFITYFIYIISTNALIDINEPLLIFTFSSLFLFSLLSLIVFIGYPNDRIVIIIGDDISNYIIYEIQLNKSRQLLKELNDNKYMLDYVGITSIHENFFYRINYHVLRIFTPTTNFEAKKEFSKLSFASALRNTNNIYYKIAARYTKGIYGNFHFKMKNDIYKQNINEKSKTKEKL